MMNTMMKNSEQHRRQGGFIALITVLVVVAVSLILATSSILKSINQATIGLSEVQTTQAWASANSCVETGLGLLGANSTSTWADVITGSGHAQTLTFGGIDCQLMAIIATTSGAETDYRLIRASSTVNGYVRKIRIVAATNTPSTVLSLWQEVGDF